jgi:hypothetical protein
MSTMRGVTGTGPSAAGGRLEHAIEALITSVRRRFAPAVPLIVPVLPPPVPAGAGWFVLDVTRLDASGRFTGRTLMCALGCRVSCRA